MKLLFVSTVVVFWNVENLFNPKPQSNNPSELSFTPGGAHRWTGKRFVGKCLSISKALLSMGDSLGGMPDAVGLCEVEDDFCLKQLVDGTLLRKWGYDFVHFDSKDPRGIDCALLYRPDVLGRAVASQRHITDGQDTLATRSFLVAEFDSLAIVVVHLPSKLGDGAQERRLLALRQLGALCDSLMRFKPVVALGDFNDTRSGESDSLMAPMIEVGCAGGGSYKFNGRWELIDRAFAGGIDVESFLVWSTAALSEPDKKFGGVKPRRTYVGPRYNGGVSDHYPIAVSLRRRR